jgi:polyhydroxyalkanoate synthesis regulator phasin
MNKRLEELLKRVAGWPNGAQEEAASALADIEDRIVEPGEMSAEDQVKLKALREMIDKSIAEGGDYSPDDIDAMIDEMAARSAKAR